MRGFHTKGNCQQETREIEFMKYNPIERRSEDRKIINRYYTVEFLINDLKLVYQFKIWDISSKGMSLLVREDSDLLNYLKVGDRLHLRYHTADSSKPIEYLKDGDQAHQQRC